MEKQISRDALISNEHIFENVSLHLKWPTYGGSSSKWAPRIRDMGLFDILDYGCGKGALKEAFKNLPQFSIREYDPAIPGKNMGPKPARLVVCTDVLEHIEPDKLESVLVHLRYLIRDKGFFVIATRESQKTLSDGRNAHLIVQPLEWWKERLRFFFMLEHIEIDMGNDGEFLVIVS